MSIQKKLEEVGHAVTETATQVGHRIAECTEQTMDWAKEKLHQGQHRADETAQAAGHKLQESCGSACASQVQKHMEVIGACGNKLGVVDAVEGSSIKLTRKDSPDGQHHLIPLSWVDHVDQHVHLSKNCGEAKEQWQSV